MNKQELVTAVATAHEITKKQAQAIIETIVDEIKDIPFTLKDLKSVIKHQQPAKHSYIIFLAIISF